MNIILHEPEIPQNAGNIARTCAATNSDLHLIKPLGFSVDNKSLKRAGLDYWNLLNVYYYNDFNDFVEKNNNPKIFMATTKARNVYTNIVYSPSDYIMFGRESAGIPEEILLAYQDTSIRIPMVDEARSLNLANSVAIVLFEALRQQDFCGLLLQGQLHRYKW